MIRTAPGFGGMLTVGTGERPSSSPRPLITSSKRVHCPEAALSVAVGDGAVFVEFVDDLEKAPVELIVVGIEACEQPG